MIKPKTLQEQMAERLGVEPKDVTVMVVYADGSGAKVVVQQKNEVEDNGFELPCGALVHRLSGRTVSEYVLFFDASKATPVFNAASTVTGRLRGTPHDLLVLDDDQEAQTIQGSEQYLEKTADVTQHVGVDFATNPDRTVLTVLTPPKGPVEKDDTKTVTIDWHVDFTGEPAPVDYQELELRMLSHAMAQAGIETPTTEQAEEWVRSGLKGFVGAPLTPEAEKRMNEEAEKLFAELEKQGVIPEVSTGFKVGEIADCGVGRTRVPTGVADIDRVLDKGLPVGFTTMEMSAMTGTSYPGKNCRTSRKRSKRRTT